MQLDHCVFVTDDVARLCAFWERVIGARVVDLDAWRDGAAEYPYLELDGWKANVHERSAELFPVAAARAVGSQDLCLVWPGPVDDALAHLARHKVDLEFGPVRQLGRRGWGTSVYFRDPDGGLVEFIAYEG